jgi:hypothetical protein
MPSTELDGKIQEISDKLLSVDNLAFPLFPCPWMAEEWLAERTMEFEKLRDGSDA